MYMQQQQYATPYPAGSGWGYQQQQQGYGQAMPPPYAPPYTAPPPLINTSKARPPQHKPANRLRDRLVNLSINHTARTLNLELGNSVIY